ncbi:PREDICTED: VQ motif-containing protein 25-like isoform X3 [Ipomoea nil]|uniref:VQ motif-containing protein 25-like isoform X2 n=1 Tax=Ipomoea nil TaxID=35883 RepID=UPI000900914C|nr:PREDICTED: VQ motif-containing protein 25-like isoform X2 [Ipomoea nil]XP_019168123.1 PREDICTED: VQ motif-containing protein 25-like isoform X3 [Ipomoea nil]
MRPSSQKAASSSSSSEVSMHKGWPHATTKVQAKPKIRIVHLIPPEVIKTSVHDFCEIVQRLTGKPAVDGGSRGSSSSNRRRSCCTMQTIGDPPMLQKDYCNNGGGWMNEVSMQDLAQFPLEVEDI